MELLELPFEVVESGVNEDQFEWEEPSEVVATLATMKAEAVRNKLIGIRNEEHDEGIIVIGADTLIEVDGEIIGKPVDRESAKEIMTKLAGKTHEVWTGICVIDVVTGERVVEVEKTEVEFGLIGEKQLEKYLETKEWEGKAGGYQIQGAIKPFVKDVRGSYTNVIGLPMITLVDMLERLGVWVGGEMEEVLERGFGYRT
jgi:septum formation protein